MTADAVEKKVVRRNDDLIFDADSGGHQADAQRNRAVDDGDAVLAAVQASKPAFKFRHLRASSAVPICRCATRATAAFPPVCQKRATT